MSMGILNWRLGDHGCWTMRGWVDSCVIWFVFVGSIISRSVGLGDVQCCLV
jgi:hypothetical protein